MLTGVGIAVALAGCSATETGPAGQSLYDRLGGKPAVTAVVVQFVANVANDTRINGRLAASDIPRLKGRLSDQMCMVTGGPCTYAGQPMNARHAGMAITNGEFDAWMGDLAAALEKSKIPAREKHELLSLFSRMKKDIVK